jgi:acyl-CoA thioesterase-1
LSSFFSLRLERRRPISVAMLRILSLAAILLFSVHGALAKPVTLLVLGDSLTAGLGLELRDAFPAKLEAALKARHPDLTIINAGVSGDTAADGLARLDWALTDEVGGLIVGLGANDALRGLDVVQTETALDGILARAKARNLPTLVLGMKAPPNMGPEYVARFDGLFPRLAEKHGVLLYPFFLEGVAAKAGLNQGDGIHPNEAGVDVIVMKVMAKVEELIGKVSAK